MTAREVAWAAAAVVLVLAAAVLGAVAAIVTLPLLDRAFANLHEARARR